MCYQNILFNQQVIDISFLQTMKQEDCIKSLHRETKQYTLVIPYDASNKHILLGLKKRGFGVGKWNGFGGKVMENESIHKCAARELKEECGIEDTVLEKMGILFLKWEKSTSITEIHVYKATEFHDQPIEYVFNIYAFIIMFSGQKK